ncbi:MAG: response regulator [Desulfobacteraceae bacterium]|nr:response regulator [Desulfobacteraceae bacterium]
MKENRRILVIDDDEGIRETYRDIFTPALESDLLLKGRILFGSPPEQPESVPPKEYEVSLAENGRNGIEKIRTAMAEGRPFAVAFIDMKMPELDGARTSQKIGEIDSDIKIVIVTAYSEYSPKDIMSATGMDDLFYLRKPFNHEEIRQFAKALTHEWNLERKRDALEASLKKVNKELENMNKTLKEKVEKQASMIVQAEKMASVGILAAGVAHEINNPIAFVDSNLSAAKKYFSKIAGLYRKYSEIEFFLEHSGLEKATGLFNEITAYKKENKIEMIMDDLEDLADESIDGINRVKTIVRDLKTFSRIDELEYKYIDINKAIDTTLNMVRNEFKYKADIQKDYGVFPDIKCFPQKISQVFMNLLINAAQAIEEKGIIKISTRLITKGRREKDRFIEITIADTGCGIAKENLHKLFDPFFITKPVGTGTGLGLSIVYEIVKAHEGSIDVMSEPGKDTRFTVLLPAVT